MAIDDLVATRKRVKDQQDARKRALLNDVSKATPKGNNDFTKKATLLFSGDETNRMDALRNINFVGRKNKDGSFDLREIKRPAASQEIVPPSQDKIRMQTMGSGKNTLQMQRKLAGRPLTGEWAKQAEWQQKVDQANKTNHLKYLLSGNRAQRMEAQRMLDSAHDERLKEERKQALADERQHALDLEAVRAQKERDVATITADAARYNADVNRVIANNQDTTKKSIAKIESETQKNVADTNAKTLLATEQMKVDAQKSIAENNRQATIEAAKIGAEAEKYVGELQALAAKNGIGITTDNQLRAAELLVSINKSFTDISERAKTVAQIHALPLSTAETQALIDQLNSSDASMEDLRETVTQIALAGGFNHSNQVANQKNENKNVKKQREINTDGV